MWIYVTWACTGSTNCNFIRSFQHLIPESGCCSTEHWGLLYTHHVTVVLFLSFFFLHRFQEFCVGWWRCLDGVFWKEWVQPLVVAPQLLPLCPWGVWLRAGHTVPLGYCLFDQTQTKSILHLIKLIFMGGSWSWFSREMLSVYCLLGSLMVSKTLADVIPS